MKTFVKTFAIMAAAVFVFSCGGNGRTATAAADNSAMEVDDLLAGAEMLTDSITTVEGVCTHACKHGATKIFLMGSDDRQVIRVEAAALGSFDTKCVNSIVRVEGILREQRIDEAYLQRWEATLSEDGETHGAGEAGCDSEKNARQETASTPAGRIADFRRRIEARNRAEGKDYLSFYYVEAKGYEIL